MLIYLPWLFFVCLLAYVAVRGEQRSSRIGAWLALLVILTLSANYVAMAYGMGDDSMLVPICLAGGFAILQLILGFFAFQSKAK